MKNIKILVYLALVASVVTTLKPVTLKLKKSLTRGAPELHEILKTKQTIDNYKTKPGPLEGREKTALNTYYKSLLQRLITDKNVRSALLETEQKSITNPEAYRLYWDLAIKRLRATITQDNAHIIESTFAQLTKESALKWALRYIYYEKTNSLIDKNDLIVKLYKLFQGIDNGKLYLDNLRKPEQLTSFLLHASKIIEALCGEAIKNLDLQSSHLTEVHLSNLPNLKVLVLRDNQLTEFNLSNLPNLEELYLEYNQLKKIDLSKLSKLKILYLSNNNLTTVDLSNFPHLEKLHLKNNKFSKKTIEKIKKIASEKQIRLLI